MDGQPLRIIIEAATAVQSEHEKNIANRRQSEAYSFAGCKPRPSVKAAALEAAETAWRDWHIEWSAAIKLLGLTADTQPEAASAQLDAIDQMREIAVEIHQLQHERIEKN